MADEPAGGMPEDLPTPIFDVLMEYVGDLHEASEWEAEDDGENARETKETAEATFKRLVRVFNEYVTAALAAARREGMERACEIIEARRVRILSVPPSVDPSWTEHFAELQNEIRALPAAPPPKRTTP